MVKDRLTLLEARNGETEKKKKNTKSRNTKAKGALQSGSEGPLVLAFFSFRHVSPRPWMFENTVEVCGFGWKLY